MHFPVLGHIPERIDAHQVDSAFVIEFVCLAAILRRQARPAMSLDIEGVTHAKHLVELASMEMLICKRYGVNHSSVPNPRNAGKATMVWPMFSCN
jgi:hypothetical protein